MNGELPNLAAHLPSLVQGLLVLTVAGLLGAALGIVRPVRRGIVPRSAHVIQAQILLAIVGAIIIVVVAESLARVFAIVGAAGLVRYRARVEEVASRVRPDIEHALEQKGVTYDLRGSSPTELTYEVTVPFGQKIRPLTKLIRHLDGHAGTLVDWENQEIRNRASVRRSS
jgi:uncharacterized membrane protein YeaQ/YmgE (transglycosylase-associated protein family)